MCKVLRVVRENRKRPCKYKSAYHLKVRAAEIVFIYIRCITGKETSAQSQPLINESCYLGVGKLCAVDSRSRNFSLFYWVMHKEGQRVYFGDLFPPCWLNIHCFKQTQLKILSFELFDFFSFCVNFRSAQSGFIRIYSWLNFRCI